MSSKAIKFEGKYEGKLEFPEGWEKGVLRENLSCGGGMDIFWNTLHSCMSSILLID